MSKRIVGMCVAVVGAAIGILGTAMPAQADIISPLPPGWSFVGGNYAWPDQCNNAGQAGEAAHKWTDYFCQTNSPANAGGNGGPGSYDLYVYNKP